MAKSKRRDKSKSSTKNKSSKNKRRLSDADEDEADNVSTFKVEKILSSKEVKYKKGSYTLYKVRWKGWTAEDDTWEPLENVASTGHVDRYVRTQRARGLNLKTPGVAMIEYDDGERQLVDLKCEKFRASMEGNDSDRDDDSFDGDPDVNNFSLIKVDAVIELLWPYVNIYFEARVVNWCPLEELSTKKSSNEKEDVQLRLDNSMKETEQLSKAIDNKHELEDSDKEVHVKKTVQHKRSQKTPQIMDSSEDEVDQKPNHKISKKLKTAGKSLFDESDDDSNEMDGADKGKQKSTTKLSTEDDGHFAVTKQVEPSKAIGVNKMKTTTQSMREAHGDISYPPKKKLKVSNDFDGEKANMAMAQTSIETKRPSQEETKAAASFASNFSVAIPKKPKPPPPPPLLTAAASTKIKPGVAPSARPTKPRPPPPPDFESKSERRGKRDKSASKPTDFLDKKSSKASLTTDPISDNKLPTNDYSDNTGKEKSKSNEWSESTNVALEQISIPAKLARVLKTQSKKEYSIENDEYLKNLESDNNSSQSSIVEEVPRNPPERVGVGVPLFNDPEDEFASDEEDEYESDISEEEIRQTANELDFEQIWRMKLNETFEMLKNGGRFGGS
eukprot:scaffold13177_cov70-Cyclotella_meneghiniana.AAC.1